jgi:hypothetical protein
VAPSYPRIILSGHAQQRKREGRDYINEELVREVLRDPTNELPNREAGRRKFWKQIDGLIYTVVIEEEAGGKRSVVVTSWAKPPIR